jgi:hypothetical protein
MLTDRDDVKIFILYLLNSIGYPLEQDILHDISVQDGFVTSFDFIEAFDELVETENVKTADPSNEEEVVEITEKGKHVAETLNGRLLSSVKEKALKSALRLLSFQKRGTKITSEVTQLPHGKYEFRCSIKDKGGELMDLRVMIDNLKQLDKTMYNFDERPEFIYKGILALLAGEANYLLD